MGITEGAAGGDGAFFGDSLAPDLLAAQPRSRARTGDKGTGVKKRESSEVLPCAGCNLRFVEYNPQR